MLDLLDRKIRQMHEALGGLATSNLSSVVPQGGSTPEGYCWSIDFSQGCTDAGLANVASLLVANIACLKDHLKAWCTTNGKSFEGDHLIDADKDVAIIHDLWNLDKHADLNRPPRSGHRPKLKNLGRQLAVAAGTAPQSFALFTFDPRTGQMKTETSGTGSVTLTVSAEVVDERGARLGDFVGICESAVRRWEEALTQAGVPIPARTNPAPSSGTADRLLAGSLVVERSGRLK